MKKPHKWLKIRGFGTFSFEEVQTPVTKSQSRRASSCATPRYKIKIKDERGKRKDER